MTIKIDQCCLHCRWHHLVPESHVMGKCVFLSMGPLPFWMGEGPRPLVREDITHGDEDGQYCEAFTDGRPIEVRSLKEGI